jgi:hypothetical protein
MMGPHEWTKTLREVAAVFVANCAAAIASPASIR